MVSERFKLLIGMVIFALVKLLVCHLSNYCKKKINANTHRYEEYPHINPATALFVEMRRASVPKYKRDWGKNGF
jgi:hypothetical protein